jgi:hypothetical protein
MNPNWGKAIVLSAVLGAFLFTQHDDHRGEFKQAAELEAAQQEAQARASREFAGRQVCGPGAVHEWISDKTLTCTPKRGLPYKVSEAKP